MANESKPQIYLISPPQFDLSGYGDVLAEILDSQAVACMRLSLASKDEDTIARSADHLREICHARDVALVVEDHFRLVERLGLDGCHLSDGPRLLRDVRKDLGQEAIIGCYCGTSKHSGLSAGEIGADYVTFGPVSTSALGDGSVVDLDLFAWWSEMIEVPVVAEGGLTVELVRQLAPVTDFLAIGAEIWASDTPLAAMKAILAPL
ncbi:MAG: thiamine phosphate synthase [Rhodobacterales bacterium]|jgi:thiamine-phosphate pyrophosphorylase|nr:thiamine phosphate synthase [Pseudomonadota bacterium]MDA1285310.1 thiamine phosphate synthase [Pseudomonadota bacterium]